MFRRWVRRLAVAVPVTLAVALVVGFYVRHKAGRLGLDRVAAVTADLDAADPRWRLADIDADRGQLPDDQNGALLISRFKSALATPTVDTARPNKVDLFDKVPRNHLLDDEGAAVLDRALLGNDAAVAIARSFRDYPRGLRRYPVSPDAIGTLLPDVQEHRTAVLVLGLDAERFCREGRPDAAVQLVPAMLNVGRALAGQPFLITALVRIACDAVTVRRLERTLALGVPRGDLAGVQAELLREADADVFWGALRGERACLDHMFVNLRTGVVPASAVMALGGDLGGPRLPPAWQAQAVDWAYQPFAAHDHAAMLEHVTAMYEVRRLPEHQQRAAFAALPLPPDGPATRITRLLLPHVGKIHDASLRHRAVMRCAGVAVAAERFRRRTGRWPDSLADLPRDVLPAVPLDPFDGHPLRYVKRPDGVTIYSVGFDEADNGGNIPERSSTSWKEPGADVGFLLFDVPRRGLPAVERPRVPAARVLIDVPGLGLQPVDGLAPMPREVGRPDS